MTDPRTTSRRQPPGHTVDGWHCWTGPSGTRYACPGDKPSTVGVVSRYSELADVPLAVCVWLGGSR